MLNRIKIKALTFKKQVLDLAEEFRVSQLSKSYCIGDGYKRVYHYHIRKTAGTSLNSSFWALADLNLETIGRQRRICQKGFVFVRHHHEAIETGNYFFANSHTPAHKLVLPPQTYTVTVLRSPVSRVLSFYRYLRWVRDDEQARHEEPYWKSVYKQTVWLGASFHEFLQNVPREHLLPQLYMFSPTYAVDEAVERATNCSKVLFTEEFGAGIDQLSQTLKLPLQEKRERKTGAAASIELSPYEKEHLQELLADEIMFVNQVQARTH